MVAKKKKKEKKRISPSESEDSAPNMTDHTAKLKFEFINLRAAVGKCYCTPIRCVEAY